MQRRLGSLGVPVGADRCSARTPDLCILPRHGHCFVGRWAARVPVHAWAHGMLRSTMQFPRVLGSARCRWNSYSWFRRCTHRPPFHTVGLFSDDCMRHLQQFVPSVGSRFSKADVAPRSWTQRFCYRIRRLHPPRRNRRDHEIDSGCGLGNGVGPQTRGQAWEGVFFVGLAHLS